MKFKFGSLFSVVALLSILSMVQESKVYALQDESIAGDWIAISQSSDTKVLPVADLNFLLGRDFLAEQKSLKLSTGEEIPQLLLYDVVWHQDREKKWSAILYANPDPASTLRSRSKEVIVGYATCWIDGDSGVFVFSLDKIDMDVLEFAKLKLQSPEYRVFSIFRRSVETLSLIHI